MREKIANSIAQHQMAINELKEIKQKVTDTAGDDVEFIVKTRQFNPFVLAVEKYRNKLDISIYTMNLLLDEAIRKERERIDKLIDMEIEKKLKK